MSKPRSAVFDCNVFLQAMISVHGPAHACWEKVYIGEVQLFVAPFILAELRRLPGRKSLKRFADFTSVSVERFIEELLDVTQLIDDPPRKFAYVRDPDDARYVDVAVQTGSMLVVSNDKDLLDLMKADHVEGLAIRHEFPAFNVLTPSQFLEDLAQQ